MTTVFLVRHARHALVDRVLLGRSNVALDANGRAEAERLSRYLAGRINASVVQSSPRTRALQTAVVVARALRCPVEIVPEIDELDTGEWTGRPFAELAEDERWNTWNRERASARPPAGESMSELQQRVVEYLRRLSAQRPEETVVIVTHAEPVRSALLYYLERPLNEFSTLEIGTASVTTLVLDHGTGKVLAVNEACPA